MKSNKLKAHHHPVMIMGCGFVITAVHKDPHTAWTAMRAAETEMRRIEALISSWSNQSQTHRINTAAGKKPVAVCDELFQLIQRSIHISELTSGAFDISGTLSRDYWNFNKAENKMLPKSEIETLRNLVNYKFIHLDPESKTVFLEKEGMKIGFGGIGKGYAANRAMQVMKGFNIKSGLINASGDLICWGRPPQKSIWNIKIPDPRNRNVNLLDIELEEGSVVTSGSYENYTMIDGVRYSHIIDPQTGLPITHTKNVTVVCPNAEFGDAIATSLSVLPIDIGLSLLNKINGAECIIIDKDDYCHFSKQLKTQAYA